MSSRRLRRCRTAVCRSCRTVFFRVIACYDHDDVAGLQDNSSKLNLMSDYSIEITQRSAELIVDHEFLDEVIRRVLHEERVNSASISLAVVDDAEIHGVNRDFLGHDYPTDVISFLLNSASEASAVKLNDNSDSRNQHSGVVLEGEIIVSSQTANREALAHGWSPASELLLYVVHGLLHLCGYDDLTDDARPKMRCRERELLAIWGLSPTGLES